MSPIQRRKERDTTSEQQVNYADHTEQDAALTTPADNDNNDTHNQKKFTTLGKIVVFLVFPVTCGILGLYMGYLATLQDEYKEISFDRDFVMPFLLALALATVVGFQTQGFTQSQVKPLVPWPKVKRVKRVVRKRREQDAGVIDDGAVAANKKDD